MTNQLPQSMLQQNLANSPGYFINSKGEVEAKPNTQYHIVKERMVEGKKPYSKIDFWKRHLLGVS